MRLVEFVIDFDDSLSWWYLEDILTSLQHRIVTERQRCIGCRTDRVCRNYFITLFSRSDVRRLNVENLARSDVARSHVSTSNSMSHPKTTNSGRFNVRFHIALQSPSNSDVRSDVEASDLTKIVKTKGLKGLRDTRSWVQ